MCHMKPAHLPTETRPLCQTWCANLGNQNCVCVWVVVFYVFVVLLGYSYMDNPTETRYFLSLSEQLLTLCPATCTINVCNEVHTHTHTHSFCQELMRVSHKLLIAGPSFLYM